MSTEWQPAELPPVGGRLHSLDHAFLTADFSGVFDPLDQHDTTVAVRSFWGDEFAESLPNLAPPATSVVVGELQRGERLHHVPLPYLWQALQTLRGSRTSTEVLADRATTVAKVVTFLPELAVAGAAKLISLKAPGVAHAIDVAASPFTQAGNIAGKAAKHSREELVTEVSRLVRRTFGENFYRARDLAPWLVVHIMRRVAAMADQETEWRATPILVTLLEETFYGSSRRTAYRVAPNRDIGHKQTHQGLEQEQLTTKNPIENLITQTRSYGLSRAIAMFTTTRRQQKAAHDEAQRKEMRKGLPKNRVHPNYEIETRRFKSDLEYAQLILDPRLLVKLVAEFMDTETPSDEQLAELQQALAGLAELSHLPVNGYKKYGFDYSDGNVRWFLAQCGVAFMKQSMTSASLTMPELYGRARLLADAASPDKDVRVRSPYAYLRSSRLNRLLDELRREALRHFGMDPAQYSHQFALQDAVVEAYIYQRARRGYLPSDTELMAEVESRRAKRFLKAIDGVDSLPLVQLRDDIRFAKQQRFRMSRATRKHIKGFFSG